MTTQAISLSAGGVRKPSTAIPPVSSAMRRATGEIVPPVTETILLRVLVGRITSGPPKPFGPRETFTALY